MEERLGLAGSCIIRTTTIFLLATDDFRIADAGVGGSSEVWIQDRGLTFLHQVFVGFKESAAQVLKFAIIAR